MSGGRDDDGLRDLRAAEYVLGTLDAGERAAFELERTLDPATEAALRGWERRLSPLARAVPAVRPGPELWGRIAAALPSGGAGREGAPHHDARLAAAAGESLRALTGRFGSGAARPWRRQARRGSPPPASPWCWPGPCGRCPRRGDAPSRW